MIVTLSTLVVLSTVNGTWQLQLAMLFNSIYCYTYPDYNVLPTEDANGDLRDNNYVLKFALGSCTANHLYIVTVLSVFTWFKPRQGGFLRTGLQAIGCFT